MRRWLPASLAELFRLPARDGFAELDVQIGKLRMLRDSYQLQSQYSLHDRIADANKDRNRLLFQ